MGLIDWFTRRTRPVALSVPAAQLARTDEVGSRATLENSVRYLYLKMQAEPGLVAAIYDIRRMEKRDGRVRRIHARIARDVINGGLVLFQAADRPDIRREWEAFRRRTELNRPEKLKSDALGLVKEGNLPLQVVLDDQERVAGLIRMPTESIVPQVGSNGQFEDVRCAYKQIDRATGGEIARFPLWKLLLARLDPENHDDRGALGMPFLEASRSVWKKLIMTEEDLVLRRRVRAPLRLSHTLEGASKEQLEEYRAGVERDQSAITTDYYLNRKGGVSPVQGDANLDQIGDVVHLLDSFFAGTPLPKGMMGYTDKLSRDILEDLKRDYYDEIDGLQDALAAIYRQAFEFHLLLVGIHLDPDEYSINFAKRRTETLSQTTDRALKLKALGVPEGVYLEELGLDPATINKRRAWEQKNSNPYPDSDTENEDDDPLPVVKITPGNGRKGESATDIGTHG